MRLSMRPVVLLSIAAVFALACAASADTLEFRDGRVVNGRYLGGTQNQVRFEVNGSVEVYPVEKILALTFGGDAKPSDSRSNGDDAVPRRPKDSDDRTADRGRDRDADTNRDRQSDSDRDRAGKVTVPAGTRIVIRMIDGVDSERNHVGDKFRASLDSDLVVNDVVVARKGTDVYGRLAEAKEAGHMAGQSELKLELTDIMINQRLQPIMTGEYEVAGKSRGKNTAEKVGGGAVAGAVIGAIAGGGKGAAIGAGLGAGAGGAVQIFTRGQQVRVPSETLLDFRIEQAFTVSPQSR
jgi:hypothetical protein